MYTKTSEQVLSPLADTVAQLILFNEQCELNNTRMPDLRLVSRGVYEQVQNMVNLTLTLSSKSDDSEFISEMEKSSKLLGSSAQGLVEAAESLDKEETQKASTRQLLITHIKGILDNTRLVLSVYDDSEVRSIVKQCDLIQQNYLDPLEVLEKVSVMDSVQNVKTCCQNLFEVAQKCKERSKELLSENCCKNLNYCVEQASKLSTQLVSLVKICLVSENQDEFAKKSKDFALKDIKELLSEIKKLVMQDKDEISSSKKLQLDLNDFVSLKKGLSEISRNAILKTLSEQAEIGKFNEMESEKFEENCKLVSAVLTSAGITKDGAMIEKCKAKVVLAVRGVASSSPKTKELCKQHLETITEEWEDNLDKIHSLIQEDCLSELSPNSLKEASSI